MFTRFKDDKKGLLNWLKTQGVQVFDGEKHAWVNEMLKREDAEAYFYVPNTLVYPDEPDLEEYYTGHTPDFLAVRKQLEVNKQPAIFVKKDASLAYLMHETFHLIQFFNAIPICTSLRAERLGSDEINKKFLAMLTPKNPLDWLKAVSSIFIRLPLDSWKHRLGIIKDDPQSLGYGLRMWIAAEQQVNHFLVQNAQQLNLPQPVVDYHKQLQNQYKLLQMFSYEFENRR